MSSFALCCTNFTYRGSCIFAKVRKNLDLLYCEFCFVLLELVDFLVDPKLRKCFAGVKAGIARAERCDTLRGR